MKSSDTGWSIFLDNLGRNPKSNLGHCKRDYPDRNKDRKSRNWTPIGVLPWAMKLQQLPTSMLCTSVSPKARDNLSYFVVSISLPICLCQSGKRVMSSVVGSHEKIVPVTGQYLLYLAWRRFESRKTSKFTNKEKCWNKKDANEEEAIYRIKRDGGHRRHWDPKRRGNSSISSFSEE